MSAPFSYLQSSGPAAEPLTQLAWGLGAVAVSVVVLTALALTGAILRRRPAPSDPASLGGTGSGLVWIYGGLAASIVALAACTIWTLVVLAKVSHPPKPPALTLQVTAHQWWWEVRYLGAAGAVFTTANEIHIPTGQPVRVQLSSHDVIHSFWIPKLAGKMDVIPGLTNVAWLEAPAAGVFLGECAEFCGLEHAHMALRVVAQPEPDFEAWAMHQAAAPAPVRSPLADAGSQVFAARCASCHTVSGTPAGGIVGPELSHLASRTTLAAGTLPNDARSLSAWIRNPQAFKPGAKMPRVGLTPDQRAQVVAYLQSLS